MEKSKGRKGEKIRKKRRKTERNRRKYGWNEDRLGIFLK